MLKKVLIPVNLREAEDRIIRLSMFLSALGTEEAVFLHAGSDRGRAGRQKRKVLEELAQKVEEASGVIGEGLVQPGSVQMEIVRAAYEKKVDFICFAFKKKNWLKRTILGSTVKDVIRQSTIPVFVYKDPKRRQQKDEVFRVLYPSSLQWGDDIILSYVRENTFKAGEVYFLHVGKRAPDPVTEEQRITRIREQLKELREQCGLEENEETTITEIGSPRRKIVGAAKRYTADLLLLGKADSANIKEPVLGSTAEEVSYKAPCSVLIIPRDIIPTEDKEPREKDKKENQQTKGGRS